MPMFIIELTYTATLADIDANMAAHVRFLKKYYAAAISWSRGEKSRAMGDHRRGGQSHEDIEAIMREDSFCQRGLAASPSSSSARASGPMIFRRE